uniref:Nucleotide-diphospho-sugar transferase domain-containing protein n=1 Tax=viral metagenome TaxID=1070528 RepID=A0A6C0ESD8_9ZZZZ
MSFITLTNKGYLDYTLNCLESLKNISSPLVINCYCLGREAYDTLTEKGYTCTLIDDEINTNFQTFRAGNWSNITHNKLSIIHENLLKYEFVCFTDGDIVYENNDFYTYLKENIGDSDIFIQNEGMSDSEVWNLCSGFMFIRSTPQTISLFDPVHTEIHKNTVGWDDQVYINSIIKQLNYKVLPVDLFPNGRYYYANNENIKPYIIHFNWTIGHIKKEYMKKYNKWFITD